MRCGQGCRAQERPCGRCPVAHRGAVRQLKATPGSGEPAHKKEAATGHPGQNLSPGSAAQPQESASEGTARPLSQEASCPKAAGTHPASVPGNQGHSQSSREEQAPHAAATWADRTGSRSRGQKGASAKRAQRRRIRAGAELWQLEAIGHLRQVGPPAPHPPRWSLGRPGALVFIGGLRSVKVGQEATQVSTDNDGRTSDPFTLSLGRRTSDPAATRVNPEGTAPRGRVLPDSTHEAPRTQASQSHGDRKQNGGRGAGGGGRLEFKGDEFRFQRLSFEGGRRWRLGGTPLMFASSSGSKVNDCN